MKKLFFTLLACLFINIVFAQHWQETYNKADSLMQKREFKNSIPLYEQALPLAEKEFGKESENYLKTRNGLGRSITYVKAKEEIEPFLLENVELTRKNGEKTALYAQSLHNIGTFYLPNEKGNNSKQCEQYLKQAITLKKKILT